MTQVRDEDLPDVEIPGVRTDKKIPQRKLEYAEKLKKLLDEYNTCLIVTVDNVGSSQIAELRKKFRGRARFLFGKNTLIRKIIREYMKEKGQRKLLNLLDLVKGNSGFIFSKGDVSEIRKEIVNNKVQCAAKAGSLAPVDVYVPAGPTGMEPTQTGFFQAMNIATRVQGGQINILEETKIITANEKVGASEAQLLSKLNIKPFFYGLQVRSVYDDGETYDAEVLDLTEEDIAQSFYVGLRNVASLCYQINYPSIINVPHGILNAYKRIIALGLSFKTYTWENLTLVKDILENPEKFANMGGGNTTTGTTGTGGQPEPKEPTPEPESSEARPTMFGDDDSSDESSEEESE